LKLDLLRRGLADNLAAEGILQSEDVRRAFLKVPRESFVWPGSLGQAYFDMPLSLGETGQTISAPHMVVIMLEALKPKPGDVVLEVGTGSGYNAALLAEMVCPDGRSGGRVVTVERVPELADFARSNLAKTGYSDRVQVIVGDGTLGDGAGTKFDGIMVTAAAPRIPAALKRQLKPNGRLLIPVGHLGYQDLIRCTRKAGDRYEEENLGGCIFVPLVGQDGY